MAKKFAAIGGLHNVFNTKEEVVTLVDPTTGEEYQENRTVYDLSSILESAQNYVNHNTVCFITADETDADDLYITDHKITKADRFIIVQNDVFSLYGSLETEIEMPDIPENTWRPLYIDGTIVTDIDFGTSQYEYLDSYTYQDTIDEEEKTITVTRTLQEDESYIYKKYIDEEESEATEYDYIYARDKYIEEYGTVKIVEPYNLNLQTEGAYIKASKEYYETQGASIGDDPLRFLSIRYDFDMDAALEYIQNNIQWPEIPMPIIPEVGDGALVFDVPNEEVHTDSPLPREVVVEGGQDENEGAQTEMVITGTASLKPNTITIDGSFSANQLDGSTVTIRYTGNADRVDWYAEGDTRNEGDLNESTAKKFVYIECMQEYFNSRQDYPYIELNDKGKQIISEDSIVFITCGTLKKETAQEIKYITDAEAFGNPEYLPGARFIWTHNKMFSANTWMPIFTRETEQHELKGITPIIGSTPYGGRLIFQGAGGIKVDNTINDDNTTGTHDRIITIDGSGIEGGGGGGGKVYTTDVFVKRDIPIGGTHLGDMVLAEGLFEDKGNVVPAEMTLHEVLYRLLYRERISMFYIGLVGEGVSPIEFEDGLDYSELVNNHSYFKSSTDIPLNTTIAFRKFKENIKPTPASDPTRKTMSLSSEFLNGRNLIPAFANGGIEYIVIAPKDSFSSETTKENFVYTLLDQNGGHWEHADGDKKAYYNEVMINGAAHYVFSLYNKTIPTETFGNAQELTVTF